jgi:osmotically-inducible protein OsmY
VVESDHHHTDEAVRRAVEDRLEAEPRIANLHLPIEAIVHDGRVTLRGWTLTGPQKDAAERLALATPGVRELNSELVVDQDLQATVGRALAADGRLRRHFPGILISCRLGRVTLSGYVESEADRQAAELLTQAVGGVREVTNRLEVSPDRLARSQR